MIAFQSEAFNAGQRELLEQIAKGAPLREVLEHLVLLIESQGDGMLCSVLLLDEDGVHVRHGAAPSLPPAYAGGLDGLVIGPNAGSCGTAAYLRERVIVDDIATHRYWEHYRDLALPHGLRSCWSSPIFAPDREVLGTFAMYYKEARGPSEREIYWVDAATHLCAIAILRDRSARSLRQSEERLRAVIEHTPNVAIQWFDEGGRVLFCNHATERMFGWSSSVLGHTLGELNFPAQEAARFMAALREVAATGTPCGPMEFGYRRTDGSDGVLLSTVFRIPSSAGKPCFVCMDVDLTEHHRMEEAVRANEKLRALIYSSVADSIFYLAVAGADEFRFLSVNPAFLHETGLTEAHVIGKRVEEVLPEASGSTALNRFKCAIATRQPVSWEEVSAYPSGIRFGSVTVAPVFDEAGRCTNLVGTIHDVTARRMAEEERRQLEAQLHQSQRMQSLGTLAGGIAHDFNNILTAIGGNADLALADLAEDHPVRQNLEEIQRARHRATELVRQILAFGRRQEPTRSVIDLREVIIEALKLLRATLPGAVQISTKLAANTPPISADSTQVHQVLMNLGTNGAHAMGAAGGTIEVSSELMTIGPSSDREVPELADGRYACVSVADTGCGMDEVTLARVFEPFFTTKPVGVGTGLGLSVVHGIMKSHGGAVTVASQLGNGTRFRLYFPAVQQEPAAANVSKDAGEWRGNGERILYVDDEKALVHVATRILTRLGYRVTGHSDSTTALQDFRSRPTEFDAVVTDLSMPGLSGFDLVRQLLRIRPTVPIVMLSGYVSPEDAELAREIGIHDVVIKPSTSSDFGRVLHRLLTARAGAA